MTATGNDKFSLSLTMTIKMAIGSDSNGKWAMGSDNGDGKVQVGRFNLVSSVQVAGRFIS